MSTKTGSKLIAGGTLALLVAVIFVLAAIGATGDTIADRVLVQQDFIHGAINGGGPVGLNFPQGIVVDSGGHVYVADGNNSRILGWASIDALSNGAPATLVIGQPDFLSGKGNQGFATPTATTLYGPQAVAVDSSGNLYVADSYNNRVLKYAQPFAGCGSSCAGEAASQVFGQGGSFSSGSCNLGSSSEPDATTLCQPDGIAVDSSGDVYIADYQNNRVLEYNATSASNPSANLVFGQGGSFTTRITNNGGISADSLFTPANVALDSAGNLYIADLGNSRVLEYNTPLEGPKTTADLVFGQSDFQSSNTGSSDASSLYSPFGVAIDSQGNVYVGDTTDNRMVEYDDPLAACAGVFPCVAGAANRVYGQPDFTQLTPNNGGVSAQSLHFPQGVAVSGSSVLVADTFNSRVLMFNAPLTDNAASIVLGQTDFDRNGQNNPDGTVVNGPFAVTVDASGHVYLADTGNNRVLGWNSVTARNIGAAASLVIGQPDFRSTQSNQGLSAPTARTLNSPAGVAADSNGNLYVSDESNNRVLEYNAPFAACGNSFPCVGGSANVVFGQSDFTGSSCNQNAASPSAVTLCNPGGLAVDLPGNLYVADEGNNRVLEYNTPLANAASPNVKANMVFGQDGDFTTRTGNKSGRSADSLALPTHLAVDAAGDLYVTDVANNRVLEYATPLATGNTTAAAVFGQHGSFVTELFCTASVDATLLCDPAGVAVDSTGSVYIADQGNNRILEYNEPSSGPLNTTANRVFGQNGSFTDNTCNDGTASGDLNGLGPDSLCVPFAVAVDSGHNLYVTDFANNRLLTFDQPVPTRTPTPTPTGKPTKTPKPTRTRTPTPTKTPKPTRTRTPTPTKTPKPTKTPTPTKTRTATATKTPKPKPTPKK